jgi:hypothetical protein
MAELGTCAKLFIVQQVEFRSFISLSDLRERSTRSGLSAFEINGVVRAVAERLVLRGAAAA